MSARALDIEEGIGPVSKFPSKFKLWISACDPKAGICPDKEFLLKSIESTLEVNILLGMVPINSLFEAEKDPNPEIENIVSSSCAKQILH